MESTNVFITVESGQRQTQGVKRRGLPLASRTSVFRHMPQA